MRLACPNQLSPTQNLLGNGMQASARNVAAGVTYATWNPLDKGAGITLSGGDLTATGAANTQDTVRSTISKATGKWYWEILIVTATTRPSLPGIANASAGLNTIVGFDANGWGYYGFNGNKYTNASGSIYGLTFTAGDTIGVAFDADGGTITFLKNNATQGVAFSSLSGEKFAATGGVGLGTQVITANFGATALTYTPPTGFNAGLYA